MRLEHALVLNRFFHGLFDARDLTELKQPLNVQEGRVADGQSYYYGALLGGCKTRRCATSWQSTMLA